MPKEYRVGGAKDDDEEEEDEKVDEKGSKVRLAPERDGKAEGKGAADSEEALLLKKKEAAAA